MNLQAFAETHRLRSRRDEAGEVVILGRDGLIYEFAPGLLGVAVLDLTPKKWGNRRRACVAVGMVLRQDGDAEGALSFDPTATDQAQLAIAVCRAKRRKVISPEHAAAGAAALERWRAKQNGPLAA